MATKARGRPPKKKRNISGLRNQPILSDLSFTPISESADGKEDNLPQHDMKDLASSEQEDDSDSEFESDDEWKGLTSIEFGKRLAALSCKIDGDQEDTDWIPYRLRQKREKKGK